MYTSSLAAPTLIAGTALVILLLRRYGRLDLISRRPEIQLHLRHHLTPSILIFLLHEVEVGVAALVFIFRQTANFRLFLVLTNVRQRKLADLVVGTTNESGGKAGLGVLVVLSRTCLVAEERHRVLRT